MSDGPKRAHSHDDDDAQKRPKAADVPAVKPGQATKPEVLLVSETGCSVLNAVNKAKDACLGVLTVPEEGEPEPLRSDVDEQLLLSITLKQPSKICAIRVAGAEAATAPRTIKLFVNKCNLAFDDVEDLPPTQVLTLDGTSTEFKLNFVKFQNVCSLGVFIEDNQTNEESTSLQRFHLIGMPIHTTNMSDLKGG